MKKALCLLALGFVSASLSAQIVISQYVETDSGTFPKGIELWNAGGSDIDFSTTSLSIWQGTNGGALTERVSVSSGVFGAGDVWVIGTTDMGTYLETTFGAGAIDYSEYAFVFNGDDSLQIQLDGIVQDTFGTVGVDPGSAWEGFGVSTANQNIELIDASLSTGDLDGWSDPSERFVTVSPNPSGVGGLEGFGAAPVPEPSTYALILGALGLGLVLYRRRR